MEKEAFQVGVLYYHNLSLSKPIYHLGRDGEKGNAGLPGLDGQPGPIGDKGDRGFPGTIFKEHQNSTYMNSLNILL